MHRDKEKYSLLIVEDNPGDALLIEEYLQEYILEPETYVVTSFAEAKAFFQKQEAKLDLIFLDLSLHDLNGEPLIRSILDLSRGIPVVVLTGYGDIIFGRRSLEIGVSDYLLKDDLTAFMLYKSIVYNIERRKYINELMRSKKRYNDLFHLSPQPMCAYEIENLKILDVNEAAITQYGYSRDEFLDMKLSDFWLKGDEVANYEVIRDYKLKPPGYLKGIYRLRKKDGTEIIVEVHSNRVDYGGREARIILANDITRQLEHTRAIEAQNTRLKEIAWTQSHVVRAPLARLLGLVELFRLSDGNDKEDREFCVQEIDNSARELDRIINEIVEKTELININVKD